MLVQGLGAMAEDTTAVMQDQAMADVDGDAFNLSEPAAMES